MKKMLNYLGALALLLQVSVAKAAGTAYFELPADFSDNVVATLTTAAGSVLVVLACMFAYRKVVKATNRS